MRIARWTVIATMFCVFVLAGAGIASASERNDNFPGVPMGIGGVSGVVDYTTDPTDIFAVTLYEGQPVTFTVTRTDTSSDNKFWLTQIFGPAATSTSQDALAERYGQWMLTGEHVQLTYTPAVTSVYYVAMRSLDDIFTEPAYGLGYRIDVSGSESAPSNASHWSVGAAPGFTLHPVYGHQTTLRGILMPTFRNIGLPFTTAKCQSSTDNVQWSDVSSLQMPSGIGYVSVGPKQTTYYRFVYDGDSYYGASTGMVTVMPSADVRNPIAPAKMSHSKSYTVYGYLKPRRTSGSYPVRIYKYRYVSGKWKSYGYSTAKASNYSSYSKYSVKIKLAYKGKWRVRAYAIASEGLAAAWSSGYDYVTVN